MKEINFLIRLKNKGKLRIIEPSEDVSQSYIRKSESYLGSAKILYDNNRLEESVSTAYYSMYYILTALLFRTGIKCKNHYASALLLKNVFEHDNSKILFAKRERIDKQYYVNVSVTRDGVKDLIKLAEEFNAELIDFISKLNTENINKYREKLIVIIQK